MGIFDDIAKIPGSVSGSLNPANIISSTISTALGLVTSVLGGVTGISSTGFLIALGVVAVIVLKK